MVAVVTLVDPHVTINRHSVTHVVESITSWSPRLYTFLLFFWMFFFRGAGGGKQEFSQRPRDQQVSWPVMMR